MKTQNKRDGNRIPPTKLSRPSIFSILDNLKPYSTLGYCHYRADMWVLTLILTLSLSFFFSLFWNIFSKQNRKKTKKNKQKKKKNILFTNLEEGREREGERKGGREKGETGIKERIQKKKKHLKPNNVNLTGPKASFLVASC